MTFKVISADKIDFNGAGIGGTMARVERRSTQGLLAPPRLHPCTKPKPAPKPPLNPTSFTVSGSGATCTRTLPPVVKTTCGGLTDERGPHSVLHVSNGTTVSLTVRANAPLPKGWSVSISNGSVIKCSSSTANSCSATLGPFDNVEAAVAGQITIADDNGKYVGYQAEGFYIHWGKPYG